jgi:hypothetical protein
MVEVVDMRAAIVADLVGAGASTALGARDESGRAVDIWGDRDLLGVDAFCARHNPRQEPLIPHTPLRRVLLASNHPGD